jgi:hypothetical protein
MAFTCTVVMDKAGGFTLTIENPDGGVTQTIALDGTSLTMTVEGKDAKSTYTQTAEKVSIKCKQFEVTASETIQMTSTKASTYESSDTMTHKSAKDHTIKSDEDVSVSAVNVKAEGRTSTSLTGGSQSKVSLAAAGATASATKVSITGNAQVEIKSPVVGVKADGVLTVESSGVATLKGSLTNVQGQLVNLG